MESMEQRIHPPPIPSTPKEAPWRQIEQIIDGLRAVTEKLETLISIYVGVPPPAPPLPPVTYTRIPFEWGKATGGTKDNLTCDGKSWATDIWAGFELAIIEGEGTGQVRRIKTNKRTSLTPQSEFDINPDKTSVFVIRTNRTVLANRVAWTHGQKVVTAAGTAEQLDDVTVPDGCQLTVIAKPGNSGTIYLGDSEADCEDSAKRFDGLAAGLAASLKVDNANRVWVDAATSADGVSYMVEQVS